MFATTHAAAMPLLLTMAVCYFLFGGGDVFAFPQHGVTRLRRHAAFSSAALVAASSKTRKRAEQSRRAHTRLPSRAGQLRMSEMPEDYPSDTGDDRFSAVGESTNHHQIHRRHDCFRGPPHHVQQHQPRYQLTGNTFPSKTTDPGSL